MSLDLYVIKDGQSLRCGYTTGSCAAGAAKAAAIMLEKGEEIEFVEIDTPADIRLRLSVHNAIIAEGYASCCVIKDAGDDPDVTDGIEIYAKVRKTQGNEIIIDGGQGVGRISRKGLFGEVGQAAINPVPQEMIRKELRKVSQGGYNVLIYVPQGQVIGEKTYNENIGIEGGISIIGTKGIVYPMSEEALLKTIYMEMDAIEQRCGKDNIVLVPGNYGEKLAISLMPEKPRVKVSNFIGDSLSYGYNKGFKSITLIGHIGKFAKLSIGAFNTHSKACDARLEAFVYYLALMGGPLGLLEEVNESLTAEQALNICINRGYGDVVKAMEAGAEKRIRRYLKDESYDVEVIIYSMERGTDIC